MSPELIASVKERLGLKYQEDAIKEELREAGYDESIIEQVLIEARSNWV